MTACAAAVRGRARFPEHRRRPAAVLRRLQRAGAMQPSLVSSGYAAALARRGAGRVQHDAGAGLFLGGAVGGWILARGHGAVFYACAVVLVLWLIIAWSMKPPPACGQAARRHRRTSRSTERPGWPRRRIDHIESRRFATFPASRRLSMTARPTSWPGARCSFTWPPMRVRMPLRQLARSGGRDAATAPRSNRQGMPRHLSGLAGRGLRRSSYGIGQQSHSSATRADPKPATCPAATP